MKQKIRYKYKNVKEGFELDKVRCPVCGNNSLNWIKVVEHTSWAGNVTLLVECWSGDTQKEKPRHLFLIQLRNLPLVEIKKTRIKKMIKNMKGGKRRLK